MREQNPHRLAARIETAVGWQERVDQSDFVVRLVPHDRDLWGQSSVGSQSGVRRESPREIAHAGRLRHDSGSRRPGPDDEREHLEDHMGGKECSHLTGTVIGGGDLHDVEGAEVDAVERP